MSYSDGDGGEGWDALADLPGPSATGAERNVRRRSSKACDQCRKSKCKCEITNPNETCKNCLVLGTRCTFLGPSRKRGPPKGYIDAIEARLHQTEALLGILLATTDRRAQTLLRDISKDPLAREIISRVDNSSYGVKGRRRKGDNANKGGFTFGSEPSNEASEFDLRSTHPSNEWQDRVTAMINDLGASSLQGSSPRDYSSPKSEVSDGGTSSSSRRQRRRVGDGGYKLDVRTTRLQASSSASPANNNASGSSRWYPSPSPVWEDSSIKSERGSPSVDSKLLGDSESDEGLSNAVGQLSINEDQQIRYHGKASGIYLLRNKERLDLRNEGDIWRFPKARVWPLLPTDRLLNDGGADVELPPKGVQEHLVHLYFTYVHPFLPILHKKSFIEAFKDEGRSSSLNQAATNSSTNASPDSNRRPAISPLLLLSIFACAARHDSKTTPFPTDPLMMWAAGDEFLERAKGLLNSTYASSRPSTVQALLLMGYREGGIGDMSLAWIYAGMAIRMAQDLGMHRVADGWKRGDHGKRLFSEWELAERRRIWFGCVVLDKFISAFIGRPIMVLESDFDTLPPNVDDLEETEEWSVEKPLGEWTTPAPSRLVSCFNAMVSLYGIFGRVVQLLYAVRPSGNLSMDAAMLESALDRWYLDLPDHLQCDLVGNAAALSALSSSKESKKPLPNVLALHMHYWVTVLVLHRPFIAHHLHKKEKQPEDEDTKARTRFSKHYDMCRTAAIHVATLTSIYQEAYLFERCPAFLIYPLFGAAILLDADASKYPDDPQTRFSFSKCETGLHSIGRVWHSAARALALFTGAKSEVTDANMVELTRWSTTTTSCERNKRPAPEQELEEASFDGVADIITGPPRIPAPAPASQIGTTTFDFVAPRAQAVPNMVNNGQHQHHHHHHHQQQQPDHSLFARPLETVYAGGGGRSYMSLPLVSQEQQQQQQQPAASPSSIESAPYLNAYPELSTTILPQLYSSGLDEFEGGLPNLPSSIQTELYQQPYSADSLMNPPPPSSYSSSSSYHQPGGVLQLQRMRHYDLQGITTPEDPMHQRSRYEQQQQQQRRVVVDQTTHAHHQTRHQPQAYLPQNYNLYM